MLAKRLALVLAGSALLAAPALAQQQPQTQPQPPAQPQATQPQASPPAGQSSAMQGKFMTQMQPDQWSVSDLDGLDVYNNNNEKIGDISELIVDKSGKIQAVVIGVGGFLGLGEHNVAMPFDQVQFMNEPRATASTATTGAGGTGTTTGTTGTAPATTGSTAQGTTGPAGGQDRQMPDHAIVNMGRDQLRAAPEFQSN